MLQPRLVQKVQGWVVRRAGVESSRMPIPLVTRLSTTIARRGGGEGGGGSLLPGPAGAPGAGALPPAGVDAGRGVPGGGGAAAVVVPAGAPGATERIWMLAPTGTESAATPKRTVRLSAPGGRCTVTVSKVSPSTRLTTSLARRFLVPLIRRLPLRSPTTLPARLRAVAAARSRSAPTAGREA